jgi:hypothetical protein
MDVFQGTSAEPVPIFQWVDQVEDGHAYVAPSLEEQRFDDESLFDFVHDWVLTYFEDRMEEFATI